MGMIRARALVVASFACALLGGCSSEPPPPPVDVQAEVDDILIHFANPSEAERWRGKLIEVAQRGPEELRTTLASMDREYTRSWRRGGGGTSLNNAGRRRVMEVTAEIGDSPGTRALLTKGVKDDEPNVVAAAARALAGWGDASGLDRLLKLAPKTEGPGREHALAGLALLAKPAERERYLRAHTGDDQVLYAATLKTFPSAEAAKRKALKQVAEGHANAHARTFAIKALSDMGAEAAVEDVAQDSLHDPATRRAALKALEKAGDADALATELETEPDDAARVAKHLYRIKSADAARAAGRVLGGDVGGDVRAILVQEFYAAAGDERPDVYAKGAGHAAVLEALRQAIEREQGQAQREAAVALGQLGDPGLDESALLQLQGQDAALDAALLEALGHLGGEAAGAHLLYTLEISPELAEGAGAGLRALAKGGHADAISGADLLALLDHDEQAVREQALSVFQVLAGDDDDRGYKPSADVNSRKPGIAAWKTWWESR